MPTNAERDDGERISALESAYGSFQKSFEDLRRSIDSVVIDLKKYISDVDARVTGVDARLQERSSVNWMTVAAYIALGLSLYAFAIRPIEAEQYRQGAMLEQLLKDESGGKIEDAKNEAKIGEMERRINSIVTEGSPITDRRLSLLEWRIGRLDKGEAK
jgi:flagellar biosynthesis/type III secretory pathway M-ring protein FliF/YscJ